MEWAASSSPSEQCREMGGIARDHPALMKPELLPFEARDAAELAYPITTYQPRFFVGESLIDVKEKITDYCDAIPKCFHPVYDPITATVSPSRHIKRLPRDDGALAEVQAEKQRAYIDNLERSH